MCSSLYCRPNNNDQYCYTNYPAVDGTTCGSGKVIYRIKIS